MVQEALVHFGGPDLPARHLRDLLQARVDAVPPGGEIIWATYYFRDRALAQALLRAAARGVRVQLNIEGAPRRRDANAAVFALLEALGERLHIRVNRQTLFRRKRGYLHSKIYFFSHPRPCVLVGSYNPSGDEPEDPAVIADIGDQDRGHNMLVEYFDPRIVTGLKRHLATLRSPLLRYLLRQNCGVHTGDTRIRFLPNVRREMLAAQLGRLPVGSTVRGAISHLKPGTLLKALTRASLRGVKVKLLLHDTERRVPEGSMKLLTQAGIVALRYAHPDHLPLHSKFILVDDTRTEIAYFGSYNFNERSRWYNNEVFVASREPGVVRALSERFAAIEAEALRLASR